MKTLILEWSLILGISGVIGVLVACFSALLILVQEFFRKEFVFGLVVLGLGIIGMVAGWIELIFKFQLEGSNVVFAGVFVILAAAFAMIPKLQGKPPSELHMEHRYDKITDTDGGRVIK